MVSQCFRFAIRSTSKNTPKEPEKAVYHFVYHETRQGPLEGDNSYFEQKRNPLI